MTNPLNSASQPFIPSPTMDDILRQGRKLLLDPQTAPVVAPPFAIPGATTLQEVRIRGDAPAPDGYGTQGWVPGEAGWPWALLDARQEDSSYPETGRSWEEWQGQLIIGLYNAQDAQYHIEGWGRYWQAVMKQWFPRHHYLGNLPLAAGQVVGDVWWREKGSRGLVLTIAGIACYCMVISLHIHNVVPVTWANLSDQP